MAIFVLHPYVLSCSVCPTKIIFHNHAVAGELGCTRGKGNGSSSTRFQVLAKIYLDVVDEDEYSWRGFLYPNGFQRPFYWVADTVLGGVTVDQQVIVCLSGFKRQRSGRTGGCD
jgi:hypothetical protein